jgi:hypothetical protein
MTVKLSDQNNINSFSAKWKTQEVGFLFKIGPYHLFKFNFSACVTREYIQDPIRFVDSLESLTKLPLGEMEGHLLYSHRIDGVLPRRFRIGERLGYVPMIYDLRVTDLTLGVEAYWAQFSGKTRGTIKRKMRLFAKENNDKQDWKCYRTPEEVADFYKLALPLSERTYQSKLWQGGLPSTSEFESQMLEASARDEVRAYLLFLHDEPVAYLYCQAEDDFLSYPYVGHDPAAAYISPGGVLMSLIIEHLQENDRFHYLVFGHGEGQLKSVFSTESIHVANIFLLKSSWSNYCKIVLHDYFTRTVDVLLSFLKRMNLYDKLRRLIRQRAVKDEIAEM